MAKPAPVLIDGVWRDSNADGSFAPDDPGKMAPTGEEYPVSSESEVVEAVEAAAGAAEELERHYPDGVADFLEAYADRIEARRSELVEIANRETALPASPRLDDIELPRTTGQLRQAAAAARERSWSLATIDTAAGIRSVYGPLGGGVAVFGPNNFPFAFNGAAGGDFAAAIAAGNSVIAKANSSHPGTTRVLAEEAFEAVTACGLPKATVQLIYRTDHEVGKTLVSHPAIAATGYTGSRNAGLVLKEAADRSGKPIYLELSSINPVVILPGALRERGEEIAGDFQTSCLMGTGQFCTNPGVILLLKGDDTDAFVDASKTKFQEAPVGTLLGSSVLSGLKQSVDSLQQAGADVVTGGAAGGGNGYSFENTLLQVSGDQFLSNPEKLQTEAFGNESLLVVADDVEQAAQVTRHFEGNLTGSVYSHSGSEDEEAYETIVPILRRKVGRLLNDKMPTGVAVTPAMNHGGPYPATGHPGFTAVGIPASMLRFAMLQCFDGVRDHRLPASLRDTNPGGMWRSIDGSWTQEDVG